MEWLYSLFGLKRIRSRKSRVRAKLEEFASNNDIVLDEDSHSWTSSSGTRCLLLDIDSNDIPYTFRALDEIHNFVTRTSLIGNERYLIIILDLDKEYVGCIQIPEEHIDPCPHIYVYNYLDHMNMENLLGQLGNRVITLGGRDGYYGPVRKQFRCYGKSDSMTNNNETMTNPLFDATNAMPLFSSPPYRERRSGCDDMCIELSSQCIFALVIGAMVSNGSC